MNKINTTRLSADIGKKQAVIDKLLLLTVLLTGIWTAQGHAVPVTAPTSGEIEKITINDVNDHWSGGVIVAGGQNIIIPRNLLIDLPANRVTLQQLFTEASTSCQTQSETGLAKGDKCNASGTGGLATITATRNDNGHVIAGDVFIEKAAESVTGQITYIDYNQGYFRINGKVGSAAEGTMVRLNDPDGRHTVQSGLGCVVGSPNCSADPRFTLDGDNYTNAFTTGYPLCIPSRVQRTFVNLLGEAVVSAQSDANGNGDYLCPDTNRPGQPVADSRRFAPILVGDSITAEGNYEEVNGVHFLSAHSTTVSSALSTSPTAGQPDYFFLDEVEIDAPGFQNRRIRSLIIGYSTLPPDIMLWSIHYDPTTNSPHEFPLATTAGCDAAAGAATCTAQGFAANAGGNIFKIRHDVDFATTTKPRWDPCAHLRGDPRFPASICPTGSIAEQFAILSPIPHELQARTGRKFASMQLGGTPLITVDIQGNEATNGQYLFPFGVGLGGIGFPEMVEIDLNALQTPSSFTGIPWNLDRRLSPGGCLDSNNDGIGECEGTPQPLDPFPFEGATMDPRTLSTIPQVPYNDLNYTSSQLTNVADRILSYVNPTAARPDGNGIGVNADGNFTSAILDWQAPPPSAGGPGSSEISVSVSPVLPQAQICSANSAFNSPPVAQNDSDNTAAGVAKTIFVLSNDSDVNGDALVVTDPNGTGKTTTQGGTVILNTDLVTIDYTPAVGFAGIDTFTYTVSDGKGGTATGTVTVTVQGISNNPPVAVDDSTPTTPEDTLVVINVLANDTDDNTGTGPSVLSIESVTAPANGTVAIVGNSAISGDEKVEYMPKANFNGVDTFTYVVADGQGGTATGTVTVTVTPVNDAPKAVNDTAAILQGTPKVIAVLDNDSDVDSATLTVSLGAAPSKGTVTTNGTTITYTANAGQTGADTFTYTVSDGALSATASVNVTISAPVVDVLAITPPAEFRVGKAEWRVSGTGSVDGKTITLRLGTSPGGSIVGTSPVALGVWTVRVKGGISPAGNTQVTAWSSGGGSVTSALTIRP
jgi:hypothetical protein